MVRAGCGRRWERRSGYCNFIMYSVRRRRRSLNPGDLICSLVISNQIHSCVRHAFETFTGYSRFFYVRAVSNRHDVYNFQRYLIPLLRDYSRRHGHSLLSRLGQGTQVVCQRKKEEEKTKLLPPTTRNTRRLWRTQEKSSYAETLPKVTFPKLESSVFTQMSRQPPSQSQTYPYQPMAPEYQLHSPPGQVSLQPRALDLSPDSHFGAGSGSGFGSGSGVVEGNGGSQ